MMKIAQISFVAALVGLTCLAGAQSTKADKPIKADKTVKKTETPESVVKGIEALAAEMEAVVKDPVAATRRDKADYFTDSTDTVDEAHLIELLSKRHHKHPAVDAYIKWQLLSLQKTPFAEENIKNAIALYRRAYMPPPRPGTGADQEMKSMLRNVNQQNLTEANAAWSKRINANAMVFDPMFAYRDDLYSRLPRTFEVIRAGFEDAEARMQRGYDSKKFVARLCGDLTSVAAGSKPIEIKNMVALTQYYASREGLMYYDSIEATDKEVKWKTGKPNFNKKKLDQLTKDLTDMANAGF